MTVSQQNSANSRLESIYFHFQYQLRNPRQGRGRGSSGVWDEQLLLAYREGLERLYRAMIAPPWSRSKLEEKVLVQIIDFSSVFRGDGGPFTASQDGVPYIALPCRTSEPTREMEDRWAMAAAVHEATHVFNCQKRPFSDLYSGIWAWFDEALAVYLEGALIPDNFDHFRFFGEWIEKPQLPLDDPGARYQAGRFAAYLANRFKDEFLNRVWMDSGQTETPLEALARLTPSGHTFLSADPEVKDVFASGYCLDSWFLEDLKSAAYAPRLAARFGERALSESFVLSAGDRAETADELDHLACRYYRFYLERGVDQLELEVLSTQMQGRAPLKAEVVAVTKERVREEVIPLRPRHDAGAGTRLTAQVTQLDRDEIDYLLLVVTNCGTRAAQVNPETPHDDGKTYTLKITARELKK